jgi:hypothetical protein
MTYGQEIEAKVILELTGGLIFLGPISGKLAHLMAIGT